MLFRTTERGQITIKRKGLARLCPLTLMPIDACRPADTFAADDPEHVVPMRFGNSQEPKCILPRFESEPMPGIRRRRRFR